MIQSVFLDSTPLGLATQKAGKSPEADACQQWLRSLGQHNFAIYLPEIADYEVRRELKRAGKITGMARLDALRTSMIYLPITTDAMRLAADLWAKARNGGWATAHPHALDGDVILAAQVLTLGIPTTDFVVATSNASHLSRYLPADDWQNIVPPSP